MYRPNHLAPRWTPEEDAILRTHYPTLGAGGALAALKAAGFTRHSASSTYNRASRIGLMPPRRRRRV